MQEQELMEKDSELLEEQSLGEDEKGGLGGIAAPLLILMLVLGVFAAMKNELVDKMDKMSKNTGTAMAKASNKLNTELDAEFANW